MPDEWEVDQSRELILGALREAELNLENLEAEVRAVKRRLTEHIEALEPLS